MKSIEFLQSSEWQPLSSFGINHSFFIINGNTIVQTWVSIGIIISLSLGIRYFLLHKKNSTGQFMITTFIHSFIDLTKQTLGYFDKHHFYFVTSLFLFIAIANTMSILPGLEEPTQDLNTALALGIISFFYIQYYAIKTEGIINYIASYFSPFFLMFPLNIIGKLASIVSIAFRLFGNIFGGSIISKLYTSSIGGSLLWELAGIVSGLNFIIILFFGVFEGLLQAFVFCMLTITYLSIAIKKEEPIIGDTP